MEDNKLDETSRLMWALFFLGLTLSFVFEPLMGFLTCLVLTIIFISWFIIRDFKSAFKCKYVKDGRREA